MYLLVVFGLERNVGEDALFPEGVRRDHQSDVGRVSNGKRLVPLDRLARKNRGRGNESDLTQRVAKI